MTFVITATVATTVLAVGPRTLRNSLIQYREARAQLVAGRSATMSRTTRAATSSFGYSTS
jgi:hypothetical protein